MIARTLRFADFFHQLFLAFAVRLSWLRHWPTVMLYWQCPLAFARPTSYCFGKMMI
jgi:hypothetical protein